MFGRIRARNPKFIKKETRILMFGKENKDYNVSKDTARIPRYTEIGAQFQCFEDKIRYVVVREFKQCGECEQEVGISDTGGGALPKMFKMVRRAGREEQKMNVRQKLNRELARAKVVSTL